MFKNDMLSFFPSGYTPRPQQVEALEAIADHYTSGKKIVLLEMPVGGGKAHVAKTAAQWAVAEGKSAFLLSSLRVLQDQYTDLWPEPELVPMKGRSNYECVHPNGQGDTAATAPCRQMNRSILSECVKPGYSTKDVSRGVTPPMSSDCPYFQQLCKATQADVTVLNFAAFLYQRRINRFQKRGLLVIDEVHGCESTLLSFVEYSIWERDLDVLRVQFPKGNPGSGEKLAEFLEKNEVISRIKERLEDIGSGQKATISKSIAQEMDNLENLLFKLDMFQSNLKETEWAVELLESKFGRRIRCRPVRVARFADKLLFQHGDLVLGMSATILDPETWARNLGLSMKDVGFVQMGCVFPKKNRPILIRPAGPMSWKNRDRTFPKLSQSIKEILKIHAGERGIIHAHSNDIAKRIVHEVRSPRLRLVDPGKAWSALKDHERSEDSVLVAANMTEGVDLKDDMARFAIMAKTPYPSVGDMLVGIRMREEPAWYQLQCALRMVQSYGRTIRSKDDHSITYVLDSDFSAFVSRNRRILPKWFTEAIKYDRG